MSYRPPGAYIEVVGLPGSGKTTAVSAVLTTVAGVATPDWNDNALISGRGPVPLRLFLCAPVLCTLSYTLALALWPWERVRVRRMWSVQRRYVIGLSSARPAVVDEGFIHVLYVTLFGAEINPVARRVLRALVRVGTRSTTGFVYLAVSKAEAARRFRDPARGSVRFNAETDEQSALAFRRDTTYEDLLAALLHSRPLVPLVFAQPGSLSDAVRPLLDTP